MEIGQKLQEGLDTVFIDNNFKTISSLALVLNMDQ